MNQILTASGMVILPRERYLTAKSDAICDYQRIVKHTKLYSRLSDPKRPGQRHFVLKPMDKTDQAYSGCGYGHSRYRVHSNGLVVIQDREIAGKNRRKRMAYGYRDVKYFLLKIHHHCGLLNPRLQT